MGQGGDRGVHSADLCEWREVVGIPKHLQGGKAPGPDGILNACYMEDLDWLNITHPTPEPHCCRRKRNNNSRL